jgi:Cu-Zn family superoxide dismutase
MSKRSLLNGAMALPVALLAACVPAGSGAPPQRAEGWTAQGALVDAAGAARGTVHLRQAGGDIALRIEATGLPPGPHGLHVHAVGRCDAPDFASAGGHWNPSARQHGRDNPMGQHAGDLPNLVIGPDGTGTLDATLPARTLAGAPDALLDGDGAAIVVHAGPDDMKTDPSGNSGGRIACAIVSRS